MKPSNKGRFFGDQSPIGVGFLEGSTGLASHHAVNDRVNDLAFAFQTWRCHQADRNGVPNLAAQRKVYFVDPLLARLPSLRNVALGRPDVTKLGEQQVGLALARAAARGRADLFVASEHVMYERTKAGKEIDFVGPRQPAVESKDVERGWRRESLTVTAAHGEGILATRNILETSGAVWALPASMLVWLLGT